MTTLFSIPKSFKGHIDIIQRNAIKSWIKLGCEIILMGSDGGVKNVAEEFNIRHIPGISKNEFNTPLLSSAFNTAQKEANNNILVYINTDMILLEDFLSAIRQIKGLMSGLFLANGRRWDLDIVEEIDFDNLNWQKEMREKIEKQGKLHGYSGIDYFVFPKNLPHNLPDFAVGRVGWDNWLIYHIRSLKIPVIDIGQVATAIHQNHGFSHSLFGDEKKKRIEGPELKKNIKLAGGLSNMLTIREADWILTGNGLKKNKGLFSKLALFYPWRIFLLIKRKLQNL